jgi:hypothetical protein
MKFCKDCKYLDSSVFIDEFSYVCKHPKAIESTDVVTGRIWYLRALCMRNTHCDTGCGPEAKLFEQKISWFKKWL